MIGIGTGLTMHALLQSLTLERVETVEIEAAMAEAARGFAPRNSSAFADPRGSILIDDAKTFFSTRNRRYDILVSEPSNPWVSGVSGLFTREFYRRIRGHLTRAASWCSGSSSTRSTSTWCSRSSRPSTAYSPTGPSTPRTTPT